MEHDGIRWFHRFVCPGVSRNAFEHCRFLLAMDGTFANEILSLTVLCDGCALCAPAGFVWSLLERSDLRFTDGDDEREEVEDSDQISLR